MPAFEGLSQVETWFRLSTFVFCRISLTRFAIKIGCLFVEFINFKTMVLSVHKNTLSRVTVNAQQISLFGIEENGL